MECKHTVNKYIFLELLNNCCTFMDKQHLVVTTTNGLKPVICQSSIASVGHTKGYHLWLPEDKQTF